MAHCLILWPGLRQRRHATGSSQRAGCASPDVTFTRHHVHTPSLTTCTEPRVMASGMHSWWSAGMLNPSSTLSTDMGMALVDGFGAGVELPARGGLATGRITH